MWELILVDFDDTLVETAPAFQQAREAFFLRMEEEGFPRGEVEEVHYDLVEPELLPLFGMGPFRLEPSFRDTYLRLCHRHGRPPDSKITEVSGKLGRDFMGHPEVMPGVLEALRALAARFRTVVYSQASQPKYQLGRIADSGVLDILGEDRVVITPEKTPAALEDILEGFDVTDPCRAVVIGNSLRSDINPALRVGTGAVLVEPYEMWHYDNVPPLSLDFLRFPTFPAAVDHLIRNGKGP